MTRKKLIFWISVVILASSVPIARGLWVLNTPTVPSDAATRLSLLFEICPRASRARVYGKVDPAPDAIPILLEVARYDPDVVKAAADKFLARQPFDDHKRSFSDGVGRQDLLRLFADLYFYMNVFDSLSFNKSKGQIRIKHLVEPATFGKWLDFSETWSSDVNLKRRRDLTVCQDQRLTHEELDRQILKSLQDVPYRNGHWELGEKREDLTLLEKLKLLLGIS